MSSAKTSLETRFLMNPKSLSLKSDHMRSVNSSFYLKTYKLKKDAKKLDRPWTKHRQNELIIENQLPVFTNCNFYQ